MQATSREQALRLTGIRPARLEPLALSSLYLDGNRRNGGIRPARLDPLALSASGRKRMVNGRATAGGEKRINLSEAIAWFGDKLNRDGPLVEIGPCSVFADSTVGVRE
jgi:hypothetical protein